MGKMERPDPVLVEIIRNELEALMDDLRIAIKKTGHSPMMKVGDFGTALCDAQGRGIGLGKTAMLHATLFSVPGLILEKYGEDLKPGDVFMINDPFGGGSHMPDLFIVAPLFWRGQRVAFASV